MDATCPVHPRAPAAGVCARCGRFYCAPEVMLLDGKAYCAECGARDDVDWLGKHYRALEGKRSGVAWSMAIIGLGVFLFGLVDLEVVADRSYVLLRGALMLYGACAMVTLTGHPRARWSLVFGASLSGAALFAGGDNPWLAGLITAFLFLVAAAVWTDVRTRLFFRVPVPRGELRKHYEREGSNPLAVTASRLAFVSLFIPGVSLLSLGLGVAALARVDKKKVPPVGNARVALGAIVFSLFTTLIWGASLFGGL